MPLNLASPGIVVREVDLTIGRVNSATDKNAAIVAPFEKGPVNLPIIIENEQDLIDNFGEPRPTDKQYENWLVASSYLAYGGVLSVVRAEGSKLQNAVDGTVGAGITINSVDDYINKGYDENTIASTVVVARNPGSWANGLKVAIIDSYADQQITLAAANSIAVGYGITQAVPANTSDPGIGTITTLDGYFKGIVTGVDGTKIDVKLVSHVSNAGIETSSIPGQPKGTPLYQADGVYKFSTTGNVAIHTNGQGSSYATTGATGINDWFDKQQITLTNGDPINWNQIADRPGSSAYADERSSKFDEMHVVVIDDDGDITGNAGTILEKQLNVSKAKDAEFSAGTASYWRKFILNNSGYIFGGGEPGYTAGVSGIQTTFFATTSTGAISGTGFDKVTDISWDQNAQGIKFGAAGNNVYTLTDGKNYDGNADLDTAGSLTSELSGLVNGYELFTNTEQYDVDFLLMGSAAYPKADAQALANKLISVAEQRKDAIAFISPYRESFITDSDTIDAQLNSVTDVTNNVLSFYAPITSTTYGVFDSGYKYMFDRFENTFRYVPLNGDIAGMCARNDINNFPWFSPAGTARGAVLNAVKLAYNPNQLQRDKLYTNRINPVIFSPGAGIILYGDKTGFGKSSAFDRINVRRLFIYLEDAISAAAKDQLFEFNDEITRTNFVNIVEPFLRDVQAKRGIFDFRVVCDETNNTAAIIDNNEFIADIFIKPARSINFIGLTFVATRTGISFEEVIGTV
tara:strand:- start:165 stop:2399 length:2235 start_codon:yes stop_codon:yes gene_type:complete